MACRWAVARRMGVAGVVKGNCRRGAEKTRCEEMWGRENARRREALMDLIDHVASRSGLRATLQWALISQAFSQDNRSRNGEHNHVISIYCRLSSFFSTAPSATPACPYSRAASRPSPATSPAPSNPWPGSSRDSESAHTFPGSWATRRLRFAASRRHGLEWPAVACVAP